jgi:PAS domain S-box-containing protein
MIWDGKMDFATISALLVSVTSLITSLWAFLFRHPKEYKLRQNESILRLNDEEIEFAGKAKDTLRENLSLIKAADDCSNKLEATLRRVTELEGSVKRLENTVPLALIYSRMVEGQDDLGFILDQSTDLFSISTLEEGGKLVWVNEAWSKSLGYTREEILEMGWEALVHPEDLERSRLAEATAWSGIVEIVNRYRMKVGSWVILRWYAAKYKEGFSLALARVKGVINNPSGDDSKQRLLVSELMKDEENK